MTIIEAVILGIVQGATEFLPVSSSGHLVFFQEVLGVDKSAILVFDIFLHVCTLGAVVIFFGKSLPGLLLKYWWQIGLGTIPAVLVGVLAEEQITALFSSPVFNGLSLVTTGAITLWLHYRLHSKDELEEKKVDQPVNTVITVRQSVLVGIAQAIAIVPGISRSGATVATGVATGMDRVSAFSFSFLLAIPAIAGAGVWQAVKSIQEPQPVPPPLVLVVGGLAAFIVGWLSLVWFRKLIKAGELRWFGYYCIVLGLFATIQPWLFSQW